MGEKLHEESKKGLKLIVQIPTYNEEATIAQVIRSIPRKIQNISDVKVLIIDDGSTDDTVEAAKKAGADYISRNKKNLGLAQTFQKGLDLSLTLGADIIVNTDADNQYNQQEIPRLIQPIIENKADIVSGNRQVHTLSHMIPSKKYGNIIGTKVVAKFAGYKIKDASSGFRAYSKEAALKLFVTSNHTYTHETLIQASYKNLRISEVPVEFRRRDGQSKLISSVPTHIKKSLSTIVRTTLQYNPLKSFSYVGGILTLLGLIPMLRFLILGYIVHDGGNHIQSLLLGSLLMIAGGMSILLGLIADLLAINRRHLEEILYRLKKNDYRE